jgi:lysophospholipase L1-like esterase
LVFRAIAVALAFFLTLAMTEGALWLLCPRNESVLRHFTQDIPGVSREVVYSRNREGLRSLSMSSRAKPHGTVRVLCVGASTTDQATQSIEDTWSGHVEQQLRQHFSSEDLRIEVAAYGRGGQKMRHTYAWCRQRLAELDPDVLVTLVGVNDLAFHAGSEYRAQSPETSDHRKLSELITRWTDYSQIGSRIQSLDLRMVGRPAKVEWHSANLPRLRETKQSLPRCDTPLRTHDPADEFIAHLEALLKYCHELHIPVVLLAQPVLWRADLSEREQESLWFPIASDTGAVRPSMAWLAGEMARFNSLQGESAARLEATFVPTADAVPATQSDFFDDCHMTDEGSRRLAEVVAPVVARVIERQLSPRAENGTIADRRTSTQRQ